MKEEDAGIAGAAAIAAAEEAGAAAMVTVEQAAAWERVGGSVQYAVRVVEDWKTCERFGEEREAGGPSP